MATCIARIYDRLPSSYTKASKLFKMQQPRELIKGQKCADISVCLICVFLALEG